MADISKTSPTRSANTMPGVAASAGGDAFLNTGRELLVVEHTNGGGSDVTLTVTTTQTIDGEAVDDKTITIGAGERHLIGPFPTNIYNDQDGKVQLGWSSETDIEVAVINP